MRWTWLFGAVALAACDSSYRRVGSGDGTGSGGTTPYGGTTLGGDDDDDDNSTGEGAPMACDRRDSLGICEEYVGKGWDQASIAADCSGPDDELLTVICPVSDIGGCDQSLGNPEGTLVWYYQGSFYTSADLGFLEADCATNGDTWY